MSPKPGLFSRNSERRIKSRLGMWHFDNPSAICYLCLNSTQKGFNRMNSFRHNGSDIRHSDSGSLLEKKAIMRITLRLIPFMFILYIVAYLDRVNVGFAALQMNADLNLSHAAFGFGGGIFFIGYFLFEIPSNLILYKTGARRWIARIMITWGLIASAMMFVTGPRSFYVLRFLLGLAEAGFFPGMLFYLTGWFPRKYLARNVALFMTATALAGVVGGPVSGALLEMHGFSGLAGWQWLFLLEGIPAALLGIVVFFYLPDKPQNASWLPAEEKEWLEKKLENERLEKAAEPERRLWPALKSGRVWALCLIYFTLVVGMYGIAMWLPMMLKSATGFSSFLVGMTSIIPYLIAAVFMVFIGYLSDRTGERKRFLAGSLVLAALGFALSISASSPAGSIAGLGMAAAGIWGALGPFWALAGSFLSGVAAAGGFALINSIGNLGGFAGPTLVGVFRSATGSYATGLGFLGFLTLAGGIGTLFLKVKMNGAHSTMSGAKETPDSRCCKHCAYFNNEPDVLEKHFRGINILSSVHGSTRGDGGICSLHERYLLPVHSCPEFKRKS